MPRASFWLALLSGAFLTSACGARTSDDELLGFGPPSGAGGGSVTGDCCSASASPGCTDRPLAECVCAVDAECCTTAWDSVCVLEVESTGCGVCGGVGGTGGTDGGAGGSFPGGSGGQLPTGGAGGAGGSSGGAGGLGNCCAVHGGSGCSDEAVSRCVCGVDAFCCGAEWDSVCVAQAAQLCGAGCFGTGGSGGVGGGTGGVPTGGVGGGTGGVGGGTGGSGGNCCSVQGAPGCGDDTVEACVCAFDPYCCTISWDSLCVSEANSCGDDCGGGTGGAGGAGGTGGVGGGTGGVGGGTGGGGGVQQCSSAFPNACGTCLCENCLNEFSGCLSDFGCIAIYSCVEQTGCTGFGCYQNGTCRGTIDSFGGLGGPSFVNALSLAVCGAASGCPCN